MPPSLSFDYHADRVLGDTVVTGKNALGYAAGGVTAANLSDVRLGQLGVSMRFSAGDALGVKTSAIPITPCQALGVKSRGILVSPGPGLRAKMAGMVISTKDALRVGAGAMPSAASVSPLRSPVPVVATSRCKKQVRWVHAGSIIAVVAHAKPGRYRSVREFICEPMRRMTSAKPSVPHRTWGATPRPAGVRAAGLVNLCPEPGNEFRGILRMHGKLTFPVSRPRLFAQRGGKSGSHLSYSPSSPPAPVFPVGGN